jgi:pimeloyl-ACP methyl ester carboxylesterase
MVHGGGRNADDYFRTALAAAFLADRLQDTVVIAPRFAANDGGDCNDDLANQELNWPCERGLNWSHGFPATGNADVTSFDVIDKILADLALKDAFPNLSAIVVAGHSGGAMFVSRYHMANSVHEGLGVPVSYVAANTVYYAYLDAHRPADPVSTARATGGSDNLSPALVPFADAANCTTYNNWPWGLQVRSGYSARVSEEQLRTQFADRPMTFLQGLRDTDPSGAGCAAQAQGPHILARGRAYILHANERLGAEHDFLEFRGCGHNFRCMFTVDQALPVLFP